MPCPSKGRLTSSPRLLMTNLSTQLPKGHTSNLKRSSNLHMASNLKKTNRLVPCLPSQTLSLRFPAKHFSAKIKRKKVWLQTLWAYQKSIRKFRIKNKPSPSKNKRSRECAKLPVVVIPNRNSIFYHNLKWRSNQTFRTKTKWDKQKRHSMTCTVSDFKYRPWTSSYCTSNESKRSVIWFRSRSKSRWMVHMAGPPPTTTTMANSWTIGNLD